MFSIIRPGLHSTIFLNNSFTLINKFCCVPQFFTLNKNFVVNNAHCLLHMSKSCKEEVQKIFSVNRSCILNANEI